VARLVIEFRGIVPRLRDFRADDVAKAAAQAVDGYFHCALAQVPASVVSFLAGSWMTETRCMRNAVVLE